MIRDADCSLCPNRSSGSPCQVLFQYASARASRKATRLRPPDDAAGDVARLAQRALSARSRRAAVRMSVPLDDLSRVSSFSSHCGWIVSSSIGAAA